MQVKRSWALGGLQALRLHGRHTCRSFFRGGLPGPTHTASTRSEGSRDGRASSSIAKASRT
eukprot:4639940-Pyramimonas_sp.AAC.1